MWNFHTHFQWRPESGEHGVCGLKDGANPLEITPPATLGGKPGYWTPEDLLVSSVESCMFLTTLSVVKRDKVDLVAYRSEAHGVMQKTPEGLRMTGIEIRVFAKVGAGGSFDTFRKAVEKAERYCPVLAAVKCPVRLELIEDA